MNTYRLTTLGCKVSRADAAAIEGALMRAGLARANGTEPASVAVVCGCAVTAVAEGKSRRAIRRIARENPGATVVAAGCIAARDRTSRDAGADVLLPPARVTGIIEALRETERWRGLDTAAESGPDPVAGFPGRTRAFLKVQDGCDGACAYCIVPRLRGRSTSRTAREILDEARRLAGAGHAEVVLVGIRLGSYRDPETRADLFELTSSLLDAGAGLLDAGLARVRLSSIEPMDFDVRLAELAASEKGLCPHFHLPLQSADDATLSRMNRPYRADEYRGLVGKIRALIPDAAITTDVIAGFPGESSDAHARTVAFIHELGFARVHAFPFSPRPGTPAAELPREPGVETARARTSELIEAGHETARSYRVQFIGLGLDVIAQPGDGEGRLSGYTERYVKMNFDGPAELAGGLVRVRALRERDGVLEGELVP